MKLEKIRQQGFTLVEMLVSIALFSVVITIGVSTLLILIEANARAQGMQLVMTNLSFSLDSMTRELRTGFDWHCGNSASEPTVPDAGDTSDCTNANFISLVESGNDTTGGNNANERRITYWFDASENSLKRSLGQGGSWVTLTGEDVNIDIFRLVVEGTTRGDTTQPRATLYIEGRATSVAGGVQNSDYSFQMETTVTQRLLDV